ncbi:MAG: hypothetical protein H6816_00065 [Phycisphaerales bacterium]|nr:hypothetical protein [Phycisphaerales bacterium]
MPSTPISAIPPCVLVPLRRIQKLMLPAGAASRGELYCTSAPPPKTTAFAFTPGANVSVPLMSPPADVIAAALSSVSCRTAHSPRAIKPVAATVKPATTQQAARRITHLGKMADAMPPSADERHSGNMASARKRTD